MRLLKALCTLVLAAVLPLVFAQEGPSTIVIEAPNKGYPFRCHAHLCFYPKQAKQLMIDRAEQIRAQACNRRSDTYSAPRCAGDTEHADATKQCFQDLCSNADCKTKDLTTGKCLSPAYFRQ